MFSVFGHSAADPGPRRPRSSASGPSGSVSSPPGGSMPLGGTSVVAFPTIEMLTRLGTDL